MAANPVTPRVVVAMPIYGQVPAPASMAFATMIGCGVAHNLICGLVQDHFGLLSQARNYIVQNTLNAQYGFGAGTKDATHILFVDADMVPPNDVIQRLGRHNKPVVSALYFERRHPFYPVFRWDRTDVKTRTERYEKGLSEVAHIGMGCALIEMGVLRRMAEKFGDQKWFAFENDEGEDIFFCRRLHEMGVPIFVDGDTICGHCAEHVVTEKNFEARAHIPSELGRTV